MDDGNDDSGHSSDPLQPVEMSDILASKESTVLPPHMRCAAHRLNLVAAVDSEDGLCNKVSKTIYRSLMAKCQSLWNFQSRSVKGHNLTISVINQYRTLQLNQLVLF